MAEPKNSLSHQKFKQVIIKTLAIEEPGGNLSLVKNMIAQQIIFKKGIMIKT